MLAAVASRGIACLRCIAVNGHSDFSCSSHLKFVSPRRLLAPSFLLPAVCLALPSFTPYDAEGASERGQGPKRFSDRRPPRGAERRGERRQRRRSGRRGWKDAGREWRWRLKENHPVTMTRPCPATATADAPHCANRTQRRDEEAAVAAAVGELDRSRSAGRESERVRSSLSSHTHSHAALHCIAVLPLHLRNPPVPIPSAIETLGKAAKGQKGATMEENQHCRHKNATHR